VVSKNYTAEFTIEGEADLNAQVYFYRIADSIKQQILLVFIFLGNRELKNITL
jgi:hypothetical protein